MYSRYGRWAMRHPRTGFVIQVLTLPLVVAVGAFLASIGGAIASWERGLLDLRTLARALDPQPQEDSDGDS